MVHSEVKLTPIMATSASGDKLIIFTPGEGRELRTEADIVRNKFGMYRFGQIEQSEKYFGWLTLSFSVDQQFVQAMVVDVLMSVAEQDAPDVGLPTMFSHFAIAYEGGAHIVAVQSKYSNQWYANTSAPAFSGIY